MDLGWWLLFDTYHSEDRGVARLDGLPDRSETLDLWVSLGGVEPTDDRVVRAIRRTSVGRDLRPRMRNLRRERGNTECAETFRVDNPALRMLALMNAL